MLGKYTSRNHRSKGLKVKHAVQLCLLCVIGMWLLYQAMQRDEENADDENSSLTMFGKSQHRSTPGIFIFGRKYLQPELEEHKLSRDNESHRMKENPEDNSGDFKTEAGGGGDDEIDGREPFRDEEDEVEDDNEDDETEEDDDEFEEIVSSQDQDPGASDRTSHEAREKHSEGNGATSSVDQRARAIETDPINGALRKVKEKLVKEKLESGSEVDTGKGVVISNNIGSTTTKTATEGKHESSDRRTNEDGHLDRNVVLPLATSDLNSQQSSSVTNFGTTEIIDRNEDTFGHEDVNGTGMEDEEEEDSDGDSMKAFGDSDYSYL